MTRLLKWSGGIGGLYVVFVLICKPADYVAVVVTGDEFGRIAAEFPLPLFTRFLMGFPPGRDLARLDPVSSGAERP